MQVRFQLINVHGYCIVPEVSAKILADFLIDFASNTVLMSPKESLKTLHIFIKKIFNFFT